MHKTHVALGESGGKKRRICFKMAFSAPQGLVLAENEGSMASLEEILMTEHLARRVRQA